MSIKSLIAASVLAATTASLPAAAAVIFQDNFDTDAIGNVLNVNSLINWTVGDGTIDYIRSGVEYGINCVGGTGGCLDMDGSTLDAGRITSKQVFTFDPGVTYTLEAMASGNQRRGANDTVLFGIVREGDGASFGTAFGPLAPNAPFTSFSDTFSGAIAPGSWRLYFQGSGGVTMGDNMGAILDNVVLRDNRAAVPEPATLALLGLGLAGLAAARRRKQ